MPRLSILLSAFALLFLGVLPATASAPTPIAPAGKPLGIVPVRSQAGSHTSSGNLLYHTGGSVMTAAPQKEYAIYWGSNFTYNGLSTYQSIINGYFQNVASDSGKSSNVYFAGTQYYQNLTGANQYVPYSQSFTGTYADASTPSAGCSSTAGGSTTCVSDSQVEGEVQKAITANKWPTGMGAEYFVFLANGWSTCAGSSCFISQFCAYHSHFDVGGQHVLYANMPFTGYKLSSCTGASGSPNGNAAADATVSVVSHESNETITDPLGNAWYDRRGYEDGDKCAYNYGTALGTVNGGNYNLLDSVVLRLRRSRDFDCRRRRFSSRVRLQGKIGTSCDCA